MTKKLRDIFPEPEKERTVQEFLEWYKNGVQELENKINSFREELSSNKRDSKNRPTAKRLKEETGALYNLLVNDSFGFANCVIKPDWSNQPFDVKIEGHKLYDFIEIVSVGVSCARYENSLIGAFGLEVIKPIVENIEQAIENKKGKEYGSRYALLVYYNNEQTIGETWKRELYKKLEDKNISQGCFEDIFITGFTMGDYVWKLPKNIKYVN